MSCLKLKDLVSPRIGKCDTWPESLSEDKRAARKENLFMEPKRISPKTPVKNELTPSVLSWRKCCTPDRVPVTPVKLTDKLSPEPWSPTANLKMLISAASPDIRDRERKKELFRQIENETLGSVGGGVQLGAIDDGVTDEFEQQRPSRKQKSLGLLCQKFLARYPIYPISTEKTEISLDEVATELGVERRRIYDIVNVLESLQLVSRLAKNQYSWHGLLGLQQTLAALKKRGEQHRYAEQLSYIHHKELDFIGEEMEKREPAQEPWTSCQELSREGKSVEAENKSAMNSRKDKSLRIMSEKFVMLFLVSEPKTVALDIAAKILIEESQQDTADNSKFKTKIRRLYDIANVLTSLGLIKKVHVTEERGRKPAFKWVGPVRPHGPDGIPDHSAALSASASSAEAGFPVTVNTKERLECPSSIHTPGSCTSQCKAQSAPCSPAKFQKVRSIGARECSSKMVQLAAACRLQFEEDMKSLESPRNQEDRQPQSTPLASCPLLITNMASSVDSPVRPLAQDGFSLPQTELSLPFCFPNAATGHLTPMPPAAVPNADDGYPSLLKNQPIVFLQSLPTAPVFMLYRNRESITEPSPRPCEAKSSAHEETLLLIPGEVEVGASMRNSLKRSPTERCTLPDGHWKDDKPEAKRGKTLCCLEHASGGLSSILSLSSMEQQSSTQHKTTLRNRTQSLDHISDAAASVPSQTSDMNLESNVPSTQTQMDNCHTEPGNAEKWNHVGTVEKGPPLMPSVNLVQPPFVIHGPSGSAEKSQSYHLTASPGMSELNLLLSANRSLGGIAVPPGQVASVSLPYQLMVPVICQPVPPTESAGNSIHNSGLVHLSLQNVNLLPTAQLIMGRGSVPTPTRANMRSSSPEQQIYSLLTQASQEDPANKIEPLTLQPGTVKLQEQSLIPITPKDDQPFGEGYFRTPVPTVQGKKMEGLQTKIASPAQRRLEIENNATK
ncbi:transcription factor E2F7-like isoform X2 [Carcharodon carcharias]|uniref:transcription factor E2F7-like isoform X2 n=1 Tax=Carcharodon carcharias TaxID=13397 RepID=UPI001B7F062B|nr:transcription factor E2F7-like isoform X2 [Carcharodon carcharias]